MSEPSSVSHGPIDAASSRKLPSAQFGVDELTSEERFTLWSDRRKSFELSFPEGTSVADFTTRCSVWSLGAQIMTVGSFSPVISRRSLRTVRADNIDHYSLRVNLGNAGRAKVDIDGCRLVAAANDIVLTDLSKPSTYHSPGGYVVLTLIPRATLDVLLPRGASIHGVVPQGPCARLLVDHLASLTRVLPELTVEEAQGAAAATTALLAASLNASAALLPVARAAMEETLARQIERYVEANLHKADLCAETICAAFRISRSALYRMFESDGGVAKFIMIRRLSRMHKILADPARPKRQLAQLADDFGFKTAAHFSRAFRETFGISPSDVRAQRHGVVAATKQASGSYDYDAWMRTLHS